ncbi:DUF1127 domain-containing protein [Bradyrhizobium sp. Pa8]|uniref:DUF1127 domain-containing protein n=1 Tax=Bradyrhizobium sp. Pa8 TaxID=3386552 RepID=UPI00403FAF7A
MLKQHRSPGANRVVRLSQNGLGKTASSVRPHDFGSHRPDVGRAVSGNLQGCPEVSIEEAEPPFTNLCLMALAFFMEGFAVYGASFHPTAAMPVHIIRASATPGLTGPQRTAADGGRCGSQQQESGNAIEFERAAWASAYSLRNWTWLESLAVTISTFWAHWRREREITRAVAALSQYDDRTLRDLGICGRAEIERVVRFCHDC